MIRGRGAGAFGQKEKHKGFFVLARSKCRVGV